MLRVSLSWLGRATQQKRSTVLLTDIASSRQTFCLPSDFCEVPNKLDPAVVVTAEHWEGGQNTARTPVSATDVHHIFPVHAGNFVVILGNGRFRRKFFCVSYPNN